MNVDYVFPVADIKRASIEKILNLIASNDAHRMSRINHAGRDGTALDKIENNSRGLVK